MTTELTLPRGIFSRRGMDQDGRGPRRPITNMLSREHEKTAHIAPYKVSQHFNPHMGTGRSVSRACQECFPSLDSQLTEIVGSSVRNILLKSAKRQSLYSRLSEAIRALSGPKSNPKRRKSKSVLQRGEIMEAALEYLRQHKAEAETSEVGSLVAKLKLAFSDYTGSPFCMRVVGWIIRTLLGFVSEGVCVHEGEIELLRRAHATGLPIIYVPVNRSHVDPFAIFIALQSSGLDVPYFFSMRANRRLAHFIGGIGLPLSCQNQDRSAWAKSAVSIGCYKALLQKRLHFSLNMEHRRTRSGKASLEPYGWEFLKELYDMWKSNVVDDAYVVPVNVSYEKLLELQDTWEPERFLYEASTAASPGFFRRAMNFLRSNLGLIRVTFGQPFTLREFQVAFNTTRTRKYKVDDKLEFYQTVYNSSELDWDLSRTRELSCSLSSLYDIVDIKEDDLEVRFDDSLCYHALYESNRCSVPLPTHVVGFLLAKKFLLKETSVEEIIGSLRWFQKVFGKEVPMGFIGATETVVYHALQMLGPETLTITKQGNTVLVKPSMSMTGIAQLRYCSNVVTPFLALEAVIAIVLLALKGNSLVIRRGFEKVNLLIKDDTLTTECLKVYNAFVGEFFLHSPCLTARAAIAKAVEQLRDKEVLQYLSYNGSTKRRVYEDDEFDDYDDMEDSTAAGAYSPMEYNLQTSNESYEILMFLKNLLSPYLEVYAAIVLELQALVNCTSPQYDLMQKILQSLRTRFSSETYGEFLTIDVIMGLFLTFENNGILECRGIQDRLVGLCADFNDPQSLKKLSENLLSFVFY